MSITINGDTGIAGVDGSASTPAVQGNDTNTGMFFPAADTIAFAEGGTEVMRLDSSGNLRVGSSNTSLNSINSANTFGFKNRIINGAMMIDQRNAGAAISVTSNQYPLDRFYVSANAAGVISAQRSTVSTAGFINSLGLTVTTARTSIAATDVYGLRQAVEGFNVSDFGFGTANAQNFTLSFWVRSSITGTYSVGFWNEAFNRNYVATYTISAANTWEQKTITIAGDTSGTWGTGNGQGITVYWDLGSGSNYVGTAGSWAASGAIRTSGSTNWISTNGATFYITGVQLEKGSTATSFDYRPYGAELQLCQRYYFQDFKYVSALVSGVAATGTNYPVEMRAVPTIAGGGTGFAEVVKTTKGLYYYQNTTNQQSLTFNAEL